VLDADVADRLHLDDTEGPAVGVLTVEDGVMDRAADADGGPADGVMDGAAHRDGGAADSAGG
jgi:hypothetical protein